MNRPIWITPAFVVAVSLLTGSAIALPLVVSQLKLHLRKKPITVELQVSSVPAQTDRWERVGSDAQLSKELIEELGTSNSLSRTYRLIHDAPAEAGGAKSGEKAKLGKPIIVELHLAYYTGMIDTVPHVPERCLVGGGWTIAGEARPNVPVPLDMTRWSKDVDASTEFSQDGKPTVFRARMTNGSYTRLPQGIDDLRLNVSQFVYPGSDRKLTAGYFFIANGGITSYAENVRLLAFDLRSEYAFYLKVQVSSPSVETADELAVYAAGLMDEILPDIMQCVPDWIEVRRGNYPANNPARKGRAEGSS